MLCYLLKGWLPRKLMFQLNFLCRIVQNFRSGNFQLALGESQRSQKGTLCLHLLNTFIVKPFRVITANVSGVWMFRLFTVFNLVFYRCTVIFLSFRTHRSWQTVQTQIRLLLQEQSFRTHRSWQTVQTQIRLLLEEQSFRTHRSWQTVQTQISLLLEEQSFRTHRSWQTVQTQIRLLLWSGSTLFAIPSVFFGCITL